MPRFEVNGLGRDFAVGDIHGCFSALARALDSIGFDRSVDRLFSVGDLVDRGPESEQVLDWLDKPWFHAICGNHDFMTWRAALGTPYPEVDHSLHGGAWLMQLPEPTRELIGRRMQALPLALEVDTPLGRVGLVHADCPFDDWNGMGQVAWDTFDWKGALATTLLWSIQRHQYRYAAPVRNIRAVVHGHKTVRSMEVLGNVYFIDTGPERPGGAFTFLDLRTLRATCGPRNAPPASKRNR